MVDNSSSMAAMQQKLLAQLPNFMTVLESLPMKPNLHVAVVSSDLGAPSDTSIGCTATGDKGQFYSQPEGTCTATTLTHGRHLHLGRRRGGQLHRSDRRTCSSASRSPARADAGSSTSSPRSIARSAQTATARRRRPTPGSCATRPTWGSSCSPTRTTARPRPTRRSTRSTAGQTEHQQPRRPDHQLPLQWRPARRSSVQGPQLRAARLAFATPPLNRRGRDRHAADPPARQLRGQRKRLERPHPRQQVRERHQGAQARSRQPDLDRRDHRPADPVRRRSGIPAGRPEPADRRAVARGSALLRRPRTPSTRTSTRTPPRSPPTAASATRASASPSSASPSRTASSARSATRTTRNR